MRKFAFSLAVVGLLALGGAAFAEIGTIDDVPAATLLLPYFEVDLNSATGVNTFFSINNASAEAAVAHVTLWTDMSLPTFDFDVYLTGFDVQTINLRNLFTFGDGVGVPRTAEESIDAGFDDTLSPKGEPEWDRDFPGSSGPCFSPYSAGDNVPASIVDNLRKAHTGLSATIGGTTACWGGAYGDNIARGYITIDNVTECNLDFPGDLDYATLLSNRNQLWGDYFFINNNQNFAQAETLVHIEACEADDDPFSGDTLEGILVGNGAGYCPFLLGDYTFYGRYAQAPALSGQDQREPLATSFATRYFQGGDFDGGTDLIVWRDSKTSGLADPDSDSFSCSARGPAWFPLNQNDVVAFDEQEQPEDLCIVIDDFSPPSGDTPTCFPLEAGRYPVEGGNPLAESIGPTSPFGWLFLNLNHSLGAAAGHVDPFPGVAQAWVWTVADANGKFSGGWDAIKLDTVLNPTDVDLPEDGINN